MQNFDFKSPDYISVFETRTRRLARIKENPARVEDLKEYYRYNLAQFITDWGCTIDPRNVDRGLPAVMPFILFDRQREWVDWVLNCWRGRRPGLTDKSRDMGVSWLSIAVAVSLCIFNDGMAVGFGSRKEEYLDRLNDPKSLFWKAREFIRLLPIEFRAGWDAKKHAPHMRILFPQTNATITAEAGDNIGRGDRTSIYFVDEAAYLQRPELVEASLSSTTNCRVDISTPCGMNNPFARKRFGGKIDVFTFHWRDDPRKGDEWYIKKCNDLDDPIVIAQEIDLDYAASVGGVIIPAAWVQAAVDAHVRLGVEPVGANIAALDVADEGQDKNCLCAAKGILIYHVETWSGLYSDIYATAEKAIGTSDGLGCSELLYDADGLGAGIRGDARKINEARVEGNKRKIKVVAFRGSGEVLDPGDDPFNQGNRARVSEGEARTNKDYYKNAKAQAWMDLRMRFRKTYRAVVEGKEFKTDEIISLSSEMPELRDLVTELSQPTYSLNCVGQIVVDKKPDGGRSPNRADSVMIRFARRKKLKSMFHVEDDN